jgi:hypothetical protein
MRLIDPPTPFSPTEEWQAFLKEMRGVLAQDPGDADVQQHIEMAEALLRKRGAPEAP